MVDLPNKFGTDKNWSLIEKAITLVNKQSWNITILLDLVNIYNLSEKY